MQVEVVEQAVILDTSAEGKIALSPKRRYVLSDLIAQCDKDAQPPADMAAWESMCYTMAELLGKADRFSVIELPEKEKK